MIIVRLIGGHSNQLFQYAAGRSLAEKHRTQLLLDTTWFKEAAEIDSPREYELGVYPLAAKTTKLKGLSVIDTRQPVGRKTTLLRRLHLGNDIWMHYEHGLGYNDDFFGLPDNTLLNGYWQNQRYFLGVRDHLLKELEPKTKPSTKNQKLIDRMKKTESVWMHIRRGDYVTSKIYNKYHGLKDIAYYKKGLETLIKKLPAERRKHIEIFVCSNDIPWCKKNMKFDFPVHFVENELGSDDMRVVKHCKHDVLANSSFSWWGAWLNDNPDKIVIAPKQWFNDKQANSEIEIVPPEWIRV